MRTPAHSLEALALNTTPRSEKSGRGFFIAVSQQCMSTAPLMGYRPFGDGGDFAVCAESHSRHIGRWSTYALASAHAAQLNAELAELGYGADPDDVAFVIDLANDEY